MIRIKRANNQYHLENSIRNSEQINTKTPCPSKKVPKNIEKLQDKYPGDQLQKEWYSLLSSLKKSYAEKIGLMPPCVREKEVRAFSTRFTYDTDKIEESKLTLSETATLLKKGIAPEGRRFWQWGITPLQDIREARAQEKLFYDVLNCKKDLSFRMVLDWHKKLFQTTKPHIAGKVRKHQISMFGSKFIPPSAVDIHSLLREFFRWYHGNQNRLHTVELAAVAHLKFVTIHPFVDGNGRIARLIMNFILHRNGYPMFNVPYESRRGYFIALERSQINKRDADFLQWFTKMYLRAKTAMLSTCRKATSKVNNEIKVTLDTENNS